MKNNELIETVFRLRIDCALKQKKGLHFILSSVIIWLLITLIHAFSLPIVTKNILTFCCSAPLMGLALLLSKPLHIDFQGKDNPLTKLCIFFSINQVIYLMIAVWISYVIPDKMLMVYAIITGAHFLPYGWLYLSDTYLFLSVFIPVVSLILGLNFAPVWVALFMLIVESAFSAALVFETRSLAKYAASQEK